MARSGYRHIPQTKAQLIAWNWGVEQFDSHPDVFTALKFEASDPGDWLNPEQRAAWDRLGSRQFWDWAMTGFHAAEYEEIE